MKIKTQLIISIIILFSIQLIAQVDKTAQIDNTNILNAKGLREVTDSSIDSSNTKQLAINSRIILNDGKTIEGKTELKSPFMNTNYILLNDSTKYEAKAIKAFENEDGYFARISGEDDFVKREAKGKIDLYSTTYSYGGSGGTFNTITTPHGSFTTFSPGSYGGSYSVEYISKDGGEVLNADYDNLREALKDNPTSMAFLDEYRTLNYVKYGAGIVGLGLIASSFIGVDKENGPNFGTMAIGGIIANIGIWIPTLTQDEKLQKSIKVYNGFR